MQLQSSTAPRAQPVFSASLLDTSFSAPLLDTSCAAGFVGGSADLAPSNMTLMKSYGDFQKGQYGERNFRFGVREHGMAAITNGMALHNSGLIPYCATFFIFTGTPSAAAHSCLGGWAHPYLLCCLQCGAHREARPHLSLFDI